MTRAEAISGTVLVVSACAKTAALLEQAPVAGGGFVFEQAEDAQAAIARVEAGERPDVVLLAPKLADPVRVAQRLHSLDRGGAIVVLADPGAFAELQHALRVAPFLSGDVAAAVTGDAAALAEQLAAATGRTRARREAAALAAERRATPPPLSASYLGTLLDSVPIGLVTLDAGGAVIGWNRRTGEMLEVPEVEALGRSFASFFAEEDAERLTALVDRLGSDGIDEGGEVFHRGERAFEMTGARFAIRSGEGGTLLILQDVTARERAEAELRLQKALSDAQADASEAGIVVLTLDERFVRANARFSEIWGIEAEEMHDPSAATRTRFLAQVEDPESFVGGMHALAATGDGEYRDEVRLKDGRVIARYAAHARDAHGNVLGRIWFHTDVTERTREEEAVRFLADATDVLSSSLDYETTLRRVADLAVLRIADLCRIEIFDAAGASRVVAAAGALSAHAPLVRDASDGSALTVSIAIRDKVVGSIEFARDGRPYDDDDDLRLAVELARRAGIAIDNSRVHAQMRETARTLQESLLPPHLPAIRGLELAARFRPAGAGVQVGGDFYDIFEIGPNEWGIAVGDVCGKGADAAALTALTRYTVRAAAMYEDTPSGVLGVLNDALLRQRTDYRFTTLAFCILDLGRRPARLRVATGGHPRPLLLREDGSTAAVGAGGPLLGVVSGAAFSDQALELNDGDTLILYTDGLTDALAPARLLDEEDLLRTLAECRGMASGELSLRLEREALAGDPERVPRDDIAIVVAKLA